jgi:hypothetical protein
MTIQNPDLTIPFARTEGGDVLMTQEHFELLLDLVAFANGPVILGTGTPESNLVGTPGQLYSDTSAGAGTGLYVKETGTGDTGWVLRS